MKTKTLLLSAIIGSALGFSAVLSAQPSYTAQAEFSINWNQLAYDEHDSDQREARLNFNRNVTQYEVGDKLILSIYQDCGIPEAQRSAIGAEISENLQVIPGRTINGIEQYRVQFTDNHQAVALKTVNLVCNRFVDRINTKAKILSGIQTVKSFKANADDRDQEQQLRNELADLEQMQTDNFSEDRRQRIDEIIEKLNQTNLDQFKTGFDTLISGVQFVSVNPAQVEQAGAFQKQ